MRFVALTSADGKIIYVNPEHLMAVHLPLANTYSSQANAVLVLASGASYAVRENVEEVMKLLGASQ